MKPRVNIIGKSNGVGLDRDMHILAAAFAAADCEVLCTRTSSRESGRRKSVLFRLLRHLNEWLFPVREPQYDLNVMLEHVWPQYRRDALINVLVPNPDFFDAPDMRALRIVDHVWVKTEQAQQLFTELHSSVNRIGFDSEDRLIPEITRQRTFFHLAGSSILKGTERLLSIWARQPGWPMLIVAGRLKFQPPTANNIQIHGGYLDDATLKRLQNESLIHICTSEAEGWGHYLVEAMSVGAAVITTDAPPMNDFIASDRGWVLPCRVEGRQRLLPRHVFDEQAFITLINEVMKLSDEALRIKGIAGRRWYEENRREFPQQVKSALSKVIGRDDRS